MKTAVCRHCRRPITQPHRWLHTDGLAECLDPWRLDRIGTQAEPEPPTRAALETPKRRRSYNDVRNWK